MKKLSAIVLSLLFAVLFSVSAFADFNVIIDDSANLFTNDENDAIGSVAYEYAATGNFSVAIVTTEDAMGKSAMEYADDYYDNLIFNNGWSEDGICFLIDMDNREIYISCAGICIDEYDDYELQSIIDRGYDCIIEGEYFKGIIAMVEEARCMMMGITYSEDSVDTGVYWTDDTYGEKPNYDDAYVDNSYQPPRFLAYIGIGVVAGLISVFAVISNYKNTGIGDEFGVDDIVLNLIASDDKVISKRVTKRKISKSNSNHRSGGGGGVSVHRSSGGVRHSGAGRKF